MHPDITILILSQPPPEEQQMAQTAKGELEGSSAHKNAKGKGTLVLAKKKKKTSSPLHKPIT